MADVGDLDPFKFEIPFVTCKTFWMHFFLFFFPFYLYSNGYYSENVDETPEDVLMELIARFGQTLMRARDDLAK